MLILFGFVGIVVLFFIALFAWLTIRSLFAGDLPKHTRQSEETEGQHNEHN